MRAASWQRFACAAGVIATAALLPSTNLTPRVGVIEVYGAHKVSAHKIRQALGVHEGDLLPASKADTEERLSALRGVLASRLTAECCVAGQLVLYVGIAERDRPQITFRAPPGGNVMLPADLAGRYRAFLDRVSLQPREQAGKEDLTNGYSLMANPEARAQQEEFVQMAAAYSTDLHRVVRESADDEQRAMAAYLLQYAPRTGPSGPRVIDDLQYALRDADDQVRLNAMRSLRALAVRAKLHPEEAIVIEPTWFVELLNSVVWSDRRNASLALVNMTESRDEALLALVRERALASVLEMARWRQLEHALPAYLLAGRLAHLTEPSIHQAWLEGRQETVLARAAKYRN